jgi:Ring hydroxylating beta subunit
MAKKLSPKPKGKSATGRRPITEALGRKERAAPRNPLNVAGCEQFLLQEARFLDEPRFDEWLALFSLDAWYWVPSEPDQPDPHETVSLIYDDRRLLETRVRRLASPRMYSQEPRSRTCPFIDPYWCREKVRKALPKL